MSGSRKSLKQLGIERLVDYRTSTELVLVGAICIAFFIFSESSCFDTSLPKSTRSDLYGSFAGTSGALLGFVLAALAVLVALPTTDRINALRAHPKWPRVAQAFFRASRALLLALIAATLGMAIDAGKDPLQWFELGVVAILSASLVRVLATIAALDIIVELASDRTETRSPTIDP